MSVDPAPPVLTIFAGPNGSGKTTLRNQFVADGYDLGDYINADDIQASWHTLAPELSSRREREMWAFHEAERQRRACLTGGRDFSFETVFSHESKLDFMRDARTAGYFIRLLFVATDSPRLNVARVAKRVKDGGHDIETDKIVNRYRRTLTLLPQAMELADHSVLFDNSRATMHAVATIKLAEDRLTSFGIQHPLPSWAETALSQYKARQAKP